MKKLFSCFTGITLALSIGSIIVAQDANKSQSRNGGGKGSGALLKLDKDGDKAISEAEAGAKFWERIGKFDKNGDGKVAFTEFGRPGGASEGMKRPGGGSNNGGGEFFKRFDKNEDGKVSKDEVPAGSWERMGKMDKNSDGAITKEEMMAAFQERSKAGQGQMFIRMDKNKDGKLTADEAAKGWDRLSKADKDGDGAVTKQEWDAAVKYMQSQAGGGMMANRKGAAGAGAGGPAPIFGKYDEDKDGKLSKEEVPEDMWGKLSRADENADGLVSKSELEAVYSKMRSAYGDRTKTTDASTKKPKRPSIEE